MRNPGITLHKLPLFVWAIFVTAILLLLSLPVLAGKIVPALNLAVCWELFSIIIDEDNQQVTFQSFSPIWNLNDCAPELSIPNCYCSSFCFGFYLAGLIEGDGTIVVPKQERSIKGKLNYPLIQIAFHIKDLPLCIIVQKWIGHGSISKIKKSQAYVLTINSSKVLEYLINLINGKIRGPKYYQFVNLYNFWRSTVKKSNNNYNIVILGLNDSLILKDNWGFIEAERTTITSKYPRLSLSFELVQRSITRYGFSIYHIIIEIATSLETSAPWAAPWAVEEIRSDSKYPQYRLRSKSLKTNQNIKNYLELFPIKGSKYLNFKDWSKILNYFEKGTQASPNNIDNIREIKS